MIKQRDKMPEKFATSQATQGYFPSRSLHANKVRRFGDLFVSALAVGTYLGPSDEATDHLYEKALVQAGLSGINFFDTAINYRCQRSERNIGYAIKKLASHGIHRDQVFLSTKGGFLPADTHPHDYENSIYKCYLNTGILSPDDIVANCHCMTPRYLQSQIDLSLKNLTESTIDLYYLHNPETQLRHVGETEFYRRLILVFELFEKNVALGKIKSYGLATWHGFRQPPGVADLLSLQRVMSCAREVAGDNHHLRAIQLPYNLAMLEAVGIPNQKIDGVELSAIAAATHYGLNVFISAPLVQAQVLKMPDTVLRSLPGTTPEAGTAAQKALQFVVSSPGVVAAMVGMKNLTHVAENLSILSEPNWSVAELQKATQVLTR